MAARAYADSSLGTRRPAEEPARSSRVSRLHRPLHLAILRLNCAPNAGNIAKYLLSLPFYIDIVIGSPDRNGTAATVIACFGLQMPNSADGRGNCGGAAICDTRLRPARPGGRSAPRRGTFYSNGPPGGDAARRRRCQAETLSWAATPIGLPRPARHMLFNRRA
jgi:hypothetical protein